MKRSTFERSFYGGMLAELIVGMADIPIKLMISALWIYNLTTNKILKNKTGQRVVPCISAVDVDRDWLINMGYLWQP